MRFTLPAHLTGANRILWKHDILLDRPLHDPFTTATVVLPALNAASVTESGNPASQAEGVRSLRLDDGHAWVELESGQYRFVSVVFPQAR
jgi:hypothetical protein